MNQKLPSDRLKEPRHPWRVAALVAGMVLVAGAGWAITAAVTAPDTSSRNVAAVRLVGGEGKPTTPQIEHKLLPTDHVAKSTTPPPPPPAPENYYGNPGPVQCGSGYVAGAVDEYGNESNCQPLGGPSGNQQCVAYDDNNNCTQWYKP